MIKSITPLKDATIYEQYNNRNTGMDSIIELNHDTTYNTTSRFLLKFNTDEIRNITNNKQNVRYVLKLYTAEQYELPTSFNVNIYPLSQAWDMGIGKFHDTHETTTGVSWDDSGQTDWINSGTTHHTEYSFNSGGGSWNTNHVSTCNFNYNTTEAEFDVTNIANEWLSGSIDNHGVIIKLENEYDLGYPLELKYFSTESHTIYQPKLFISYDDFNYDSGSIEQVNSKDITISIKNLRNNYKQTDITKMNLHVRERYVQRTYNLNNEYLLNYHLPIKSYYSIIDGSSETIIIPFSDYTQISLNKTDINHFILDMNNFYPERHYKIIFKVIWDDFEENIYDNNFYFKIER